MEKSPDFLEDENIDGIHPKNRGCLGCGLALCGVLLSSLFLLNLSGGFLEIPDNIPVVGNIDEVFATGLLLGSLQYLGLDFLCFFKR